MSPAPTSSTNAIATWAPTSTLRILPSPRAAVAEVPPARNASPSERCERNSGTIAATFDERDDAVKAMLGMAISAAHRNEVRGATEYGVWRH